MFANHKCKACLIFLLFWLNLAWGISFRSRTIEKTIKESYETQDLDAKNSAYQERWFEQPLDHNGIGIMKKWKQKYFFNKEAVRSSSDKCVLYIGGESPLSKYEGMVYEWAKSLGAYYVLLEHRFYGQSQPTSDWSLESLKYLSSTQALQDIANFIENVELPTKNGEKCQKWLLVGGSYAGTLVAWFGLKYPHLVQAGIAASPPVYAQLDFPEYSEVIENVLKAYSTPGNESCVNIVRDSLWEVTNLINSTSGRAIIQKLFNLCTPISSNHDQDDIYYLWSQLYTVFPYVVQYNRDDIYPYSVRKVCNLLESSNGTALERLAKLNEYVTDQCIDFDYKKAMDQLGNVSSNPSSMTRQWYYQVCSEFGWLQSYGKYNPTSFVHKMCLDAYSPKLTINFTEAMGKSINVQYGGFLENYQFENVLVVNGLYDPWHPMSLKLNRPDHIGIDGASHCTIMSKPMKNEIEPPEMPAARQKVLQFILNKMN